jgi:hypothetical protein
MNTQELLDDIQDECTTAGVNVTWDKFTLLQWLSAELGTLSSECHDADFLFVHLDPIVTMVAGTRKYNLPSNFGVNFAPAAGTNGEKFCATISDGTNSSTIDYISPAEFFSKNLEGESAGRPSKYTITSGPNGVRQISFSPPPDDDYTAGGLYLPTDWKLTTMDSLPPIPGNSAILKYSVLRRISPDRWNDDYSKAKVNLAMTIAKSKTTRIIPRTK